MMRIDLPCEVVRDLLPGYIDGLCAEVTKEAVSEHLEGCAECRNLTRKMVAGIEGSASGEKIVMSDSEGDEQLMKKIKNKLNKKTKITIAASVVVIVLVAVGFNLLFNMPLQEVSVDDVRVEVHSYAMADLAVNADSDEFSITFGGEDDNDTDISLSEADAGEADADTEMDDSRIYAGENDNSSTVRLTMPDNPNMVLDVTTDVIDKRQYVSLVSWSSPYFLRDIRTEVEDGVMYVHGIKTTLLNNKVAEITQAMTSLEMRKIDKVVYVHGDGTEQVLWQENNK